MSLLFAFPGQEALAESLSTKANIDRGDLMVRYFPDGESLVQIKSDVKDQNVMLLCGLDQPDQKTNALLFFAETAKELGARNVGLITPYLGYMRQDKRFHDGEAITSEIFARLISQHIDWLVTVDPHLHRHKTMEEIYSIPATVLHAADAIAEWVQNNVDLPVLIGPDEESHQWVSDVAAKANAPFMVLKKIRHGDKDVEVSMPDIDQYRGHTPVLIDDIISTARTMTETVHHLNSMNLKKPVCVGVHAVFAGDGYETLESAGVERIVTCNTIPHPSNAIDLSDTLAGFLKEWGA